MKTLKEFVAECGGQENAARKLGVPLRSLWRWLHGKKVGQAYIKILRAKGLEQ